MTGSEATCYACVAVAELKKESVDITTESIKMKMWGLMDEYTEKEIAVKYEKMDL
jgi:hypothetical protein